MVGGRRGKEEERERTGRGIGMWRILRRKRRVKGEAVILLTWTLVCFLQLERKDDILIITPCFSGIHEIGLEFPDTSVV